MKMKKLEDYLYYEEENPSLKIYCGDCLEILPLLPKVDLVVTDPPYGIGESNKKNLSRGKIASPKDYGDFDWDKKPITQELINMVIDKGNYSCVWGGNYYCMKPSSCWLFWDKQQSGDFADGELAWTNYGKAVRRKVHLWNGMIRKDHEARFHPTQKPKDVILWAITLSPSYESILDPFLGSGTTLVACKELNRNGIGIEISEKYCAIAKQRLKATTRSLF